MYFLNTHQQKNRLFNSQSMGRKNMTGYDPPKNKIIKYDPFTKCY